MPFVHSVGHGTAAAKDFAALARDARIDVIVDIRRFPGSRRNPQYAQDAMAVWLPQEGVAYEHEPLLGGRRKLTDGSVNLGLRNEQFRGYADYMYTADFAQGIERLMGVAATRQVAMMCSESVWWLCHRRLVADHLVLVHETPVRHLLHDGRVTSHVPTPEAALVGNRVVYASPLEPETVTT